MYTHMYTRTCENRRDLRQHSEIDIRVLGKMEELRYTANPKLRVKHLTRPAAHVLEGRRAHTVVVNGWKVYSA